VGGWFSKSEKTWIPSVFKLTIEGLDCSKVSKIDPFTVKQKVVVDEIGDEREIVKAPSRVVFPNLRMTLPESGAQSWLDWHEDFVIKGKQRRLAGTRRPAFVPGPEPEGRARGGEALQPGDLPGRPRQVRSHEGSDQARDGRSVLRADGAGARPAR
jgi:hypothetical protein